MIFSPQKSPLVVINPPVNIHDVLLAAEYVKVHDVQIVYVEMYIVHLNVVCKSS